MPRGLGGRSLANVANFLHGIDFPASRRDLVDCAEQNGAPEEVLNVLGQLPDQQYRSMADVMKAYGQVE
ncbi:MAG: DUF2795 domain-containing protein [Armatimonadetes bacterium]|nr:DUF2795 domain-containing protein [Armatimonadota bacterium]